MKTNPFRKDIDIRDTYEFADFKEAQSRLNHLLNTKRNWAVYGNFWQGKNIFYKILHTKT